MLLSVLQNCNGCTLGCAQHSMPLQDVSVVNFVPSNPLHSGGEVPKGDSLHEPLQMGKGTGERPPLPPFFS